MIASNIKSPGVYIDEVNAFPNAVVPVATAVPAFIGYTPQAAYQGKSYLNQPVKVGSFAEFRDFFILPDPPLPADPSKQYDPQFYFEIRRFDQRQHQPGPPAWMASRSRAQAPVWANGRVCRAEGDADPTQGGGGAHLRDFEGADVAGSEGGHGWLTGIAPWRVRGGVGILGVRGWSAIEKAPPKGGFQLGLS